MRTETPMVIDCHTCPVRHVRCDDCLVTALARTPSLPVLEIDTSRLVLGGGDDLPLDAAERRAVDVFVRAGLVDPQHAAGLTARREPRGGVRAVG